MQKTLTLQQVEGSDELFFELTDEMLESLDADVGDTIEWIDNKDGSWTLRKATTK